MQLDVLWKVFTVNDAQIRKARDGKDKVSSWASSKAAKSRSGTLFVSTTSSISGVKRAAKTTDSKGKTEEDEPQISLFYPVCVCVCVGVYDGIKLYISLHRGGDSESKLWISFFVWVW